MIKNRTKRIYQGIAIIMLAVFFLCFLTVYYCFLFPYREFYFASDSEFQAINLSTNIVPQGIEYLEDEKIFLISGYEYPDGYTRIIVIDSENNKIEKSIVNSNGQKFKWHSGGIASHGDKVYVTGGNRKCYVLSKKELLNPDNDTIRIIGTIHTESNSSFCFVYGNCLFIGEYQYRTKFLTDERHHLMSPKGNLNTAMVFAYPFTKDNKYGVAEDPIMALSIGSSIQGMCMDKSGRMYLSASSARFDESILYVYDFRKVVQTVDSTYLYNDEVIPVFVFEDDALMYQLAVPPNAEGVTAYKDSIYILFESASRRFKYGWLFGTQNVFKIDVKSLIKK